MRERAAAPRPTSSALESLLTEICDEEDAEGLEPQVSDGREHALRLAAAGKLLPIIPRGQWGDILGISSAVIELEGSSRHERSVMEHLLRISHRQIDGIRRVVEILTFWLQQRAGRELGTTFDAEVPGSHVVDFLNHLKKAAAMRAERSRRQRERGENRKRRGGGRSENARWCR